jgi:hypothetical protein
MKNYFAWHAQRSGVNNYLVLSTSDLILQKFYGETFIHVGIKFGM